MLEWQPWDKDGTESPDLLHGKKTPLQLTLRKAEGEKKWNFVVVDETKSVEIIAVEVKASAQYKKLKEIFAYIGEVDGKKIGVEFAHNEDQLKLEDMFDSSLTLMSESKEISGVEEPINLEALNEDGVILYFASVVITNEAKTTALALASTSKCVDAFPKILYFALLDYLKADNRMTVIEKLYEILRSLDLKKMPLLSYAQKRVHKNSGTSILIDDKDDFGLYYCTSLSWNSVTYDVHLPICSEIDEFLLCSVKKLLVIFKKKIMRIYDAILLEKRVLFVATGDTTTAQQLSQLVCAAALLVSPPLFGILNRVYPYCVWEDLEFLTVKGFIAGTKNGALKMRKNWYDICCDVNSGTVTGGTKEYTAKRYYKDDCEFVEQLLGKVAQSIGEEEVRHAFSEYTMSLLEVAIGTNIHYNVRAESAFMENQWGRIFILKRAFCKDTLLKVRRWKEAAGITNIEKHVKKLRFSEVKLSNEELLLMFKDIKEFLKVAEQRFELLALLPKYNEGIHLIGMGLFSSDKNIVKTVVDIIRMILEFRVGKRIFMHANLNIQGAYYEKLASLNVFQD